MGRPLLMVVLLLSGAWAGNSRAEETSGLPIVLGTFAQQFHTPYTTAEGLPSNDVQRIVCDGNDVVHVQTAEGFAVYREDRWMPLEATEAVRALFISPAEWGKSVGYPDSLDGIRDYATRGDTTIVASEDLLAFFAQGIWGNLLPGDGKQRWAPVDVRGVDFSPRASSGSPVPRAWAPEGWTVSGRFTQPRRACPTTISPVSRRGRRVPGWARPMARFNLWTARGAFARAAGGC